MSRDQLLETNVKIVADVTAKAAAQSPDAVLIVVSNPLDRWCSPRTRFRAFRRSASSARPACSTRPAYRAFIAAEIAAAWRT